MNHWLSSGPLPFGKIEDCGISGYHEFACSKETFDWLAGGAMTHVDGVPVRLQVMATIGDNVVVHAWPNAPLARTQELERQRVTRTWPVAA